MSPPQAPTAPPPAGKSVTLTGIYNVLEALRQAQGERVVTGAVTGILTAKEKHIHTQALVAVLKDLHDELDAAVAQAYGWEDLQNWQGAPDKDELLTRLVALNAKRAAEEKQGQVRWLRPEFQNPAARELLQNKELLTHIPRGLQADLASAGETPTTAWPATLPEQVRALAAVLAASTAPWPWLT
jgi:hypothetical protein